MHQRSQFHGMIALCSASLVQPVYRLLFVAYLYSNAIKSIVYSAESEFVVAISSSSLIQWM